MTVLLKVLGCIQGLFEVQWVSESYVSSVILYVSDLTNESPASLSARLRLELSIPDGILLKIVGKYRHAMLMYESVH